MRPSETMVPPRGMECPETLEDRVRLAERLLSLAGIEISRLKERVAHLEAAGVSFREPAAPRRGGRALVTRLYEEPR